MNGLDTASIEELSDELANRSTAAIIICLPKMADDGGPNDSYWFRRKGDDIEQLGLMAVLEARVKKVLSDVLAELEREELRRDDGDAV